MNTKTESRPVLVNLELEDLPDSHTAIGKYIDQLERTIEADQLVKANATMNEILNNLYHDCKAQLLKCKRLAAAAKTPAEATFEIGKASGIYLIFEKAYGISDQSIELSAIVDSIRDSATKTIECGACLRSVTTISVKANDGFCPICDSEIDLSEEQQ